MSKADGLVLSFDDFTSADTADMDVIAHGKPTGWIWTFAGPGHPKTIDLNNQAAREQLRIERDQAQARVNGRKWKAPDEAPDEIRARNIDFVVKRLLGWSEVSFVQDPGGEAKPFPFSEANAREFIGHPGRQGLLQQALEFLLDDASFTRRSETT